DPGIYYMLDGHDPDFPNQFKVLADFEPVAMRTDANLEVFSRLVAKIAHERELLPLDRTAVARLAEFASRVAGQQNRLSTRMTRIADSAGEASFIARQEGATTV